MPVGIFWRPSFPVQPSGCRSFADINNYTTRRLLFVEKARDLRVKISDVERRQLIKLHAF